MPRGRAPGRRCSRTDLDNTVIRAPFSGIAISKDAQPGEMVSPVSAGGGFTRTGICTIVDMESLEIEVDVNESYINRVKPRAGRHGGARRVSGLADSGAGHHDRADRRSQKATVLVRIGFNELDPRILPDMGVKVTFLREADEAAAPDGAAGDAGAEGGDQDRGQARRSCSSCADDVVERRAVRSAAPTATGSKCWPVSAPANASWCPAGRRWPTASKVVVK